MLGFAHDWANREATLRSWDMVARYVIPALNGLHPPDAGVGRLRGRQPGRADGRRDRGGDEQDHGPRGRGEGDGATMAQMAEAAAEAAARGEQSTDTTFRPGAGLADAHQAPRNGRT